jgi:hypothetical protein
MSILITITVDPVNGQARYDHESEQVGVFESIQDSLATIRERFGQKFNMSSSQFLARFCSVNEVRNKNHGF